MKQILYDTVSQTIVHRAVHSKERRAEGLCMSNIWIRGGGIIGEKCIYFLNVSEHIDNF